MNPDWSSFVGQFNTPLTPQEESNFLSWARSVKQDYGKDILKELDVYDWRGFWKNASHKEIRDVTGESHAPDRYKKPSHPTFSKESIYSKPPYVGGDWLSETEFSPSVEMMSSTHPLLWLHDYMRKNGEGVKVVVPTEKIKNIGVLK